MSSSVPSLVAPFLSARKESRPAFVSYITCGFPTVDEFVPTLLGLQRGGSDIIEIGVPFTDPLADGPSIQKANQTALLNGITSLSACLDLVRQARSAGLTVPLVLMGYFNPFRSFAESSPSDGLFRQCAQCGVSGFIIVDLPPEEAISFRAKCVSFGLSFIPLVAPTTTDERLSQLGSLADSFVYAVSLTGTTGAKASVSAQLPDLLKRIRKVTDKPIAVGFGIGNRQQLLEVHSLGADGVVIGSAIINCVADAEKGKRAEAAEKFCREVTGRERDGSYKNNSPSSLPQSPLSEMKSSIPPTPSTSSSAVGRFGSYGGRFVPETLVAALDELEYHYNAAKNDPSFHAEVHSYWDYIGRPSRLHIAERLTEYAGGAKIWLKKREDLNHTGAHKINNAIAQAILAKRLNKPRLIAETGAGQHGVATATICAKLGIPLTVYMGSEDVSRQQLNVFRMRLMGATVVPVDSGSRTLKDAINEAMRDWVTNIQTTHYLIGSAIGPHPFPTIVRDFQSIIGKETRQQFMEKNGGKLPTAVVACVGGGSNAIGMFHPFVNDKEVRMVGVEAGGSGLNSGAHSATLTCGTPGVLHGTMTYLLQDDKGQILETHSISAGLDYPGVGPEHSHLKDIGRAEYVAATDKECLLGFSMMARLEGIIPALESAHAIYHAVKMAKTMKKEDNIVICVSGRGDKDLDTVIKQMPKFFPEGINF